MMMKGVDSAPDRLGPGPAAWLRASLRNLLLYLQNGDNDSTYLIGLRIQSVNSCKAVSRVSGTLIVSFKC